MSQSLKKTAFILLTVLLTGCAHHSEAPSGQPDQAAIKGVQALTNHQYEQAHTYFNYALRYDPRNCHVNFLNALTYQLQSMGGDYHKLELAKAGFQLAYKFCPQDPWPSYYLASIAQQSGNYALAKRYYLISIRDAQGDVRQSIILSALDLSFDSNDYKMASYLLGLLKHQYPATRGLSSLQQQLAQLKSTVRHTKSGSPIASANSHYKQCVVNAIIIVMRHVVTSNKGVNLLNGIKLQYGNGTTPGFASSFSNISTSEWNKYISKTDANNTGNLPDLPFSKLITNTISIPSVEYDLNIFNHTGEHDEVLARPSIVVEDGHTAKYFSGTNLIIGIQGTQDGQIQSFPLGVSLSVKPTFEKDGSINMDIGVGRQLLISNTGLTSFDQVAQTLDENTNTSVDLHFGQTVVLSTMSEDVTDSSSNKTPGLGSVPLLGAFFSNKHSEKIYTSVIFLLTPSPMVDFLSHYDTSANSALTQSYYDNLVHPSSNLRSVFQSVSHLQAYHGVTNKLDNQSEDLVMKQAISTENRFLNQY